MKVINTFKALEKRLGVLVHNKLFCRACRTWDIIYAHNLQHSGKVTYETFYFLLSEYFILSYISLKGDEDNACIAEAKISLNFLNGYRLLA